MKEYLLTTFPNPERKGCPDEETVKGLARRKLPLNDPALLHIASCSECYAEYRNYRLDLEEGQGPQTLAKGPVRVSSPKLHKVPIFPVAIAAGLALLCVLAGYVIHRNQQANGDRHASGAQIASNTPVPATVDLSDATTLRSGNDEPNPLPEVTLPATVVRLSVLLPRFSQTGSYTILVSKDRIGQQVAAVGSGATSESQGKVTVNATLDLRGATPGAYFLATVRGSDNGTYYYPLKVK